MPANLTPQYLAAEEKFRQARSLEEKLEALKEMLATVPKHKGTEKLQKEIKTKISKLRKEMAKKPSVKRTIWYHFEKKGAGQVAVFGFPNCGKSALVKLLTKANTEVAPYPYTTIIPSEGMMPYEDIQVQLIDTPPLNDDPEPWFFHILRSADSLLYLLDLASDDLLEDYEKGLSILKKGRLAIIEKEMPWEEGFTQKKTIIVGNKIDCPGAEERLKIIKEITGEIISVSVEKGIGLDNLKRVIFKSLDIIRVYTKPPGKPPDFTEPVILKTGSSVLDCALHLHKDFAHRLKYARLWSDEKYQGQRVERLHILKDKDIIEFHI